jgi:hypothetical protein
MTTNTLIVTANAVSLNEEESESSENGNHWSLTLTMTGVSMTGSSTQGSPVWTHKFTTDKPNANTRAEWQALTDGVPRSKVIFRTVNGNEFILVDVDPTTGDKLMWFVNHPSGDYSTTATTFSVLHSAVAEILDKELTSAAERGFKFPDKPGQRAIRF